MPNTYRRTTIRQTNEDYRSYDRQTGRGGNLTPLQQRYTKWWREVRSFQLGRLEMSSAVFGFKARRQNGKITPLGPDTRIREIDSLSLLSINPLLKSIYMDGPNSTRYGKYRVHMAEQVGYVDHGEVCFGGKFVGAPRVDHLQHLQADLGKCPLQDHQVYAQVSYDPEALGEQMLEAQGADSEAATVKSPIYGNFAVVRDDLFLRFTVEGFDVCRFQLADADLVEITAASGEVQAGQALATLKGKLAYLVAEPWASRPHSRATRPAIDKIEGDSLSATHYVPQLSFAVGALHCTLSRDLGYADESLYASESYWPVPVLQLGTETLVTRRQLGWTPNPLFQTLLLRALSPDAVGTSQYFCVRSPCDGEYLGEERKLGYKLLSFRNSEGATQSMAVPSCAEVSADLPGEVTKGQDIGDFVPRCYFESYDQMVDVADGAVVKIEDAFFDSLLIRSGESNWVGEGALLDGRLAGPLREFAASQLIDTAPMFDCVDKTFGIATLPAVEFDVLKHGFHRHVNGIHYDVTPVGYVFSNIEQQVEEAAQPRRSRQKA